jgi:glycosyltransferase involved in cell wall biosynthesis
MIVYCHLLNDNSGSPLILREVIRILSNDNNSILFIGSEGKGFLEDCGIPIKKYWYRRSRFKLITFFTYILSQFFLYRSLSLAQLPIGTIVYVNTLLPFGAAIWAYRKKYKIIYHIHEISISPNIFKIFLVSVVEKTANKVFFVSNDHSRRLQIEGVQLKVIPNPVLPNIAKVGFLDNYVPRRSGYFNILMIASPRGFKGVPEFFNLAKYFEYRRDIFFTLVLNADIAEVNNYIKKFSLSDNIDIYPRSYDPNIYYAKADVLLNLSRVDQWIETFGLTILEGMTFGLPVIAPPIGGPTEIVIDGQEGYLVDSRDQDKLRISLLKLADSPELALSMSKYARARASHFTIDQFEEKIKFEVSNFISGNT